jgi:hypothetical protein
MIFPGSSPQDQRSLGRVPTGPSALWATSRGCCCWRNRRPSTSRRSTATSGGRTVPTSGPTARPCEGEIAGHTSAGFAINNGRTEIGLVHGIDGRAEAAVPISLPTVNVAPAATLADAGIAVDPAATGRRARRHDRRHRARSGRRRRHLIVVAEPAGHAGVRSRDQQRPMASACTADDAVAGGAAIAEGRDRRRSTDPVRRHPSHRAAGRLVEAVQVAQEATSTWCRARERRFRGLVVSLSPSGLPATGANGPGAAAQRISSGQAPRGPARSRAVGADQQPLVRFGRRQPRSGRSRKIAAVTSRK